MKKDYLFVAILLISIVFGSATKAQTSMIYLYMYSGKVHFRENGKMQKPVRDKPITQGTVLCVDDNAYAIVVNENNIPIAINSKGEYSLKKLKALYSKSEKSNITQEFFAYVLHSMYSDDSKKHTSGGVYKTIEPLDVTTRIPSNNVLIVDSVFAITYEAQFMFDMYLKFFTLQSDTVLIELPMNTPVKTVNIREVNLLPGESYRWVVEEGRQNLDVFSIAWVIRIADDEFKQVFNDSLNNIDNTESDPIMRNLAKLRLYRDYNIYPIPEFSFD